MSWLWLWCQWPLLPAPTLQNTGSDTDQIWFKKIIFSTYIKMLFFFFKWSYRNWIDSVHLFLVSTCFILLRPRGDSAAVLSCYFWCSCWTDCPVCPQTFIRSNGEQRLWLCPTFHTLVSTLKCSTILCVALISACATLSHIVPWKTYFHSTANLRVIYSFYLTATSSSPSFLTAKCKQMVQKA